MCRSSKRFQGAGVRAIVLTLSLGGLLSFTSCALTGSSAMTEKGEIVEWALAALNEPSATGVTTVGNPRSIDCPHGKGVEFDGRGDALFLDVNPLLNLRRFTIEVIFRPDPEGPAEQRFLHMGEVDGDRMMMETRVTPDNQWCLDAYIRSGDSSRTLIDKTKLHPTGSWHHAALVVNNGAMDTYVDGKHELEGYVQFSSFTKGSTSIGARMNRVYWFKGAIYKIKITPKNLGPAAFLKY